MKANCTSHSRPEPAPVAAARLHFAAFREATRMGIRLVRAGATDATEPLVGVENTFCGLLGEQVGEAGPCSQLHKCAGDLVSARAPVVKRCQAGLVHVVAPVIRDGLHIASLEGGQVFSRRPVEHDFLSVLERFPGWRERKDFSRVKAAYFQTPVLNGQQLRAALSLFSLISQSLTFDVLRHLATERTPRRSHMDRARAFVNENLVEPITLGKAARHVHLCPAYFCRLFRKKMAKPSSATWLKLEFSARNACCGAAPNR